MVKWAILASGQSLTDDDVEYIRSARNDGRLDGVIAVSDVGLLKAPWADALVSFDSNWWIAHPEALEFKGKKFSARGYRGTLKIDIQKNGVFSGINSGLYAMFIARDAFKATDLILLGFDMHGTHFFGPHTAKFNGRTLTNTRRNRFNIHKSQFSKFRGCAVTNCTPGTALETFPKAKLRDII